MSLRLSLKYRIAVMIFLLEAVMMGIVLWQTLGQSLESSRTQLAANEQALLGAVSGISRIALLTEEYADLQPYFEDLLKDPRIVRVMLVDAQNRVVASTRPDDVGSGMPALTDHGDAFWRSREIANAAGPLGVLAMEFSNAALLETYARTRNLGLGIALIGMLIIAIAGVLAGFLLTRRLERITRAAQRFAQGEQVIESGVHGHDELGELARSFDDMAGSVARNQHRLQESEHYNRMLFEQSNIGLALCSMEGELVDINPAFARIIGRSVEETLQLSYWDITPEKYAEDEKFQLETLNSTGHYGPYEKEYIHKDGHLVPVRLQGSLLKKDGQVFIWSSIENITERKQTEEALRESQRMLQLVLDSIPVRVFWKDRDCVYLGCNQHFASDAGLESPGQIIGKTDFELGWRKQAERYRSDDRQVMQSGEPKLNYEEPQSRPDTPPLWLQTSKIPLRDLDGNIFGVMGVYEDITERKQAEEALRRSQKMDAIGQLSGGIAHDFNNQLSVIIGYLDFLKDHFPEYAEPHQWVDTASKATLRCMDLTRQLLAISRRQSREKIVVDLNSSLQDLENMIARSVTPEVKLEYSIASDLWMTEIDPGEFQDAILNLVINARDAMPNGGKLMIETANKTLGADYVALNPGVESGDYIQLMLSDTGTGMDRETQEHIFEPFFTTKPEGKGTGLGLAMVYGFAKRYGGHIKVYSEPGTGTTIRLYLPRTDTSEAAAAVSQADRIDLPTGDETVLVVDDEADLLQLAEQYLGRLGYRTRLAENAAQALDILAKEDGVDLLFSDVVMPGGMNGYELAQQATQLRPGIRILLTSGFTSKTMAHNGLARFSAHLLNKPYRISSLAQRIRLVLDSAPAATTGPPDAHDTEDRLAGRTILVIDDEDGMRELFKLNLEKLGCKTLLAGNGDEAVTLYRQSLASSTPVDAVIFDLTLPGDMEGEEIARKIRDLDPHARMIVSSGHTEDPRMTNFLDFGFNAALEKNFDREEIRQVLEQVLTSD